MRSSRLAICCCALCFGATVSRPSHTEEPVRYVEASPVPIPAQYFARWLAEVEPIATAEEAAAFSKLSNPAQQVRFQESFWRQRDPAAEGTLHSVRLEHRRRRRLASEHVPDPRDERYRMLYALGLPERILVARECPGVEHYRRSAVEPVLHSSGSIPGCHAPPPITIYRYPPTAERRQEASVLFAAWTPQGSDVQSCLRWQPPTRVSGVLRRAALELERVVREQTVAGCEREYPRLWAALSRGGMFEPSGAFSASFEELLGHGFKAPPADPDWPSRWQAGGAGPGTGVRPLAELRLGYVAQRVPLVGLERVRVSPPRGDKENAKPPPASEYAVSGAILLQPGRGSNRDAWSEDRSLRLLDLELSWWRAGSEQPVAVRRTELTIGTTKTGDDGVAARWSLVAGEEDRVVVVVVHDALGRLVGYGAFALALDDAPGAAKTASTGTLDLPVAPALRIADDLGSLMVAGSRRVDVRTRGPVSAVRFFLDGELAASDAAAPFSATVDFGAAPLQHTLRVLGYGASGERIASDERVVNAGLQKLDVELGVEEHASDVDVGLELQQPIGSSLDRIEIFQGGAGDSGESLVARFFEPPYETVVRARGVRGEYLRAVVTLEDGRTTEDVRVLDDDIADRVEVDAVELYATVTDRRGHFLDGLESADFSVLENGAEQRVQELALSTDSELSLLFLVDLSGSMARQAELLRASMADSLARFLRPGDRASILAFRGQVEILVPLTEDLARLRQVRFDAAPEGGTALYDALYLALGYLDGLEGKKALVLVSDGLDGGSQLGAQAVLEYAQSTGISIYVLGLGAADLLRDRLGQNPATAFGRQHAVRTLERLAVDTGGLGFLLRTGGGLAPALASIEVDLRSQYRIVYQSTNEGRGLRRIDVRLAEGRRGRVRTRTAYYP